MPPVVVLELRLPLPVNQVALVGREERIEPQIECERLASRLIRLPGGGQCVSDIGEDANSERAVLALIDLDGRGNGSIALVETIVPLQRQFTGCPFFRVDNRAHIGNFFDSLAGLTVTMR